MLRLLPRATFVSALWLSGEWDNHAVVDRPRPELKTYGDPFPNVGRPRLPVLIHGKRSVLAKVGVVEDGLLNQPIFELIRKTIEEF